MFPPRSLNNNPLSEQTYANLSSRAIKQILNLKLRTKGKSKTPMRDIMIDKNSSLNDSYD